MLANSKGHEKLRRAKMEKTYELINSNGCLFDTKITTSLKKAREYFNSRWSGNYKILCVDDSTESNVRLA